MHQLIVRILDIKKVQADEKLFLKELTLYQIKKSKRFKIITDYYRSVSAYYLINKYTAKNPLRSNKYGKPVKKNEQFNIAHSGDLVVFVKYDKPIGVDIEQIRDYKPELVKRVCNEQDKVQIVKKEDFFIAWTQKESLMKCIGTGFAKYNVRDIPAYPIGLKIFKNEVYYSKILRVDNYIVSINVRDNADFSVNIIYE